MSAPVLLRRSQFSRNTLHELFLSRLRVVLFALVRSFILLQLIFHKILEVVMIIHLMKTFLFIVGIFNIPAVIALITCTIECQVVHKQIQQTTKILLKVGIAKAIGGVLLAFYICLKCALMAPAAESSSKATLKLYAIYLGASAIADIVYSLLALFVIKRTKEIVKVLKMKRPIKRRLSTCTTTTATSSDRSTASAPGSGFCSEDEGSEKVLHNGM